MHVCHLRPQKKRKKAEGTVAEAEALVEAEGLSSRPAWVVDHNLANLWKDGLSEDMIPEDLRLSPAEMAKLERLREWAAVETAALEEAAQPPAPLTAPPPPPVVAAAAWEDAVLVPPATPRVFDPAALAQAAALKAGPRVGVSPDTVLAL